VLLLDEPCSALIPSAPAKIEELLVQLTDLCTIVIVTHNIAAGRARQRLHRVLLIGQLIEFSPTPQLFTTPVIRARRPTSPAASLRHCFWKLCF